MTHPRLLAFHLAALVLIYHGTAAAQDLVVNGKTVTLSGTLT